MFAVWSTIASGNGFNVAACNLLLSQTNCSASPQRHSAPRTSAKATQYNLTSADLATVGLRCLTPPAGQQSCYFPKKNKLEKPTLGCFAHFHLKHATVVLAMVQSLHQRPGTSDCTRCSLLSSDAWSSSCVPKQKATTCRITCVVCTHSFVQIAQRDAYETYMH